MKLTVYYDDQFWVGVVEEAVESEFKAAKYIFGPEPHESDILWFINHRMMNLLAESKPLMHCTKPLIKSINPKRLARKAANEMKLKGISTSSQEAIKANFENHKKERQIQTKLQQQELADRKRKIATLKAKAKRKGK